MPRSTPALDEPTDTRTTQLRPAPDRSTSRVTICMPPLLTQPETARASALQPTALHGENTSGALVRLPAVPDSPPNRSPHRFLMRKYDAMTLDPGGNIINLQQIAPAIPVFEDGFSAFAHGTLMATDQGPVAVEDLVPGNRLRTGDGDFLPLLWKGELRTVPDSEDLRGHATGLVRLQAESFGMSRPSRDLVLGASARLIERNTRLSTQTDTGKAAIPVNRYVDGERAFALTPTVPVTLCHLQLERHCGIIANGLECESYHPGHAATRALSHELAAQFLSLFPHIDRFEDFGPEGFTRLSDTPRP